MKYFLDLYQHKLTKIDHDVRYVLKNDLVNTWKKQSKKKQLLNVPTKIEYLENLLFDEVTKRRSRKSGNGLMASIHTYIPETHTYIGHTN